MTVRSVLEFVGEWKKGRCHMSSPDLCARGKKYPEITFPLCHL